MNSPTHSVPQIYRIPPNFRYSDVLRILRGIRNGMYYGGKVRLMHGLVMALAFGEKPLLEKLKTVFKNTFEHSAKLGIYVGLYKFLVLFMQKRQGRVSKNHFFLAGIISGFMIYRNSESGINQQMILYLVSRDIIGGARNLQIRGFLPNVKFFSILAAFSWGLVMLLYEDNKTSLQRSLSHSMDFLY